MEALVVAWLCWLYDMLTNLAPARPALALAHARAVLHLERLVHLDPELALNRWLAPHHALALALSDYYDNAHFVVTLGLLGLLWWRRPDAYRPLRNVLVVINLIGFAVFWLYPMAPPRMLAGAGFTDVVALTNAFGSSHASGPLASAADQYAAMPSLHLAWAAWCVMVTWRLTRRRWLRGLAVGHLAITWFAVLATANHFLADVLAGLATAALALALVRATAWEPLARARVSAVTKLLRSGRTGRLAGGRHIPLQRG
ncbi:MAG: phosphatase PAP2 family protein [Solirubrobacterales bacterium]|nr:phosphatase PAP2 family protein [Solirubrobacterales bacterium]